MSALPAVAVALVTAPSTDVAERIVRALVDERVAACGNILPGVTSIYRWEGAVERAEEVLIVFKTERAAVPKLVARVQELHPYDVPEVVVLPVETGLPAYLEWVVASTGA